MNTNGYGKFFSKAACGMTAVVLSLGISNLVASGMERSGAQVRAASIAQQQPATTSGQIVRLESVLVTASGHARHAQRAS